MLHLQPSEANPHHLIFVADPQLIDPHSYPSRPWPLNPLTMMITDNYLRRGYSNLQHILEPDTTMFLGDLFDGGREWKTAQGDFDDPSWAPPHPKDEAPYVKSWNRKYGEDYWLQEYARFNDIFFKPLGQPGKHHHGQGQKGRKVVASLPGNHDLGFGDQVKVAVRDRFTAYFGEGNRVDVLGNHTVVSVDTVSLSAGSSDAVRIHKSELEAVYGPAEKFLQNVRTEKRKAVEKELRFWRGEVEEVKQSVGDAEKKDSQDSPTMDPGTDFNTVDFPTILLTHVPLYRAPGTPCGPMREHWPPTPPDQNGPLFPDHRNAISVSAGYQYQNVLQEEDSVKLVKSIGNVVHVFSGDDHDYCELRHNEEKERVKEITVKSASMAMGVPTPGFVMVSLWNPVDTSNGRSLLEAGLENERHDDGGLPTMQTHLCLLPKQFGTFARYGMMAIATVVVLAARALLFPVMGWMPFALEDLPNDGGWVEMLPLYNREKKVEPASSQGYHHQHGRGHHGHRDHYRHGSSGSGRSGRGQSRTRHNGIGGGSGSGLGIETSGSSSGGKGKRKDHKWDNSGGKWEWAGSGHGPSGSGLGGRIPRIEIRTDYYDDEDFGKWKASRRGGFGGWWFGKIVGGGDGGGFIFQRLKGFWCLIRATGTSRPTGRWDLPKRQRNIPFRPRAMTRDFFACLWRVCWMVGVIWVWLNLKG